MLHHFLVIINIFEQHDQEPINLKAEIFVYTSLYEAVADRSMKALAQKSRDLEMFRTISHVIFL